MPPKPHTQKTSTTKAQKLTWNTAGQPKQKNMTNLVYEIDAASSKMCKLDDYEIEDMQTSVMKVILEGFKNFYELSMDAMKTSRIEAQKKGVSNPPTYNIQISLPDNIENTQTLCDDLIKVLKKIAKWMDFQNDNGIQADYPEVGSPNYCCLQSLRSTCDLLQKLERHRRVKLQTTDMRIIKGAVADWSVDKEWEASKHNGEEGWD